MTRPSPSWFRPAAAPTRTTPGRIGRYGRLLRLGVADRGLEAWSKASLARILAALPAPAGGPAAVTDLLTARDVTT
jgi:hypothetical protein